MNTENTAQALSDATAIAMAKNPPLEVLASLPAPECAAMRKVIRRRITEARRLLCQWRTPEERAWLSGYLAEAERALAVCSGA